MRICFDVSCNLYKPKEDGFFCEPDQARIYFLDKTRRPRFNAASAFDDSHGQYLDFTDRNELFECLAEADELVTFNGRLYDLVALELLMGEDRAKILWGKCHHDLCGWRDSFSLDAAVNAVLPNLAPSFESIRAQRELDLRNAGMDEFFAIRLANTYRDCRCTYALFQRYLKSGDSDRTFFDSNLTPLNLL
jgi:hypothetical protein